MPPKGNTARRGGGAPRPHKRPQPGMSGGYDDQSQEEDDGQFDDQTDAEKRQVRRTLREMYEKLQANRDKYTAGTENEEFSNLLKEANDILAQVKGTQEAIEDAKMFRLLCQSVREMSEDTNTNEKKFHVDEYCANLGRFVNASTDGFNNLKVTRRQLISVGEKLSVNFKRTPTFTFVLGAIDTEAAENKPAKAREPKDHRKRAQAPTKTAIVEKSQANEQKTDRLVNSTRKILEQVYKQKGKKPVSYFEFVIDPESFGNTVENMFHVSFLVKQRVCCLSVDDNLGLPVLEPVIGRGGGEDSDEHKKNQAVISISYQDWQDLKEALGVTEPAIVHEEELRKAIRGN